MELRGTVEETEQTLSKVFPPSAPPAATFLLTIHCPHTYLRKSHTICLRNVEVTYPFTISLFRKDLYRKPTSKAFLVRDTDSNIIYDLYANEKGVRLASSKVWTISVDEPETPVGTKYLAAPYKNFKATEYTPDETHLYNLDLRTPAEPLLWINSEIEQVQGILNSKGTREQDTRLREVFFDLISAGVLNRLLLRSISEITRRE